jgi:cell division protein FtsW
MKPGRQRMSFGAATASVLLALLCAVQLLAVLRTPAAWLPREIAVTLQPGTSIVLGRAELGAPRAAARQLTLRRDTPGCAAATCRWSAVNRSRPAPRASKCSRRMPAA